VSAHDVSLGPIRLSVNGCGLNHRLVHSGCRHR
jgi:hypothetical protein